MITKLEQACCELSASARRSLTKTVHLPDGNAAQIRAEGFYRLIPV